MPLRHSLFFNKVAGLYSLKTSENLTGFRGMHATFQKETLAQEFSSELCEISKNTFFKEHLWTTVSYTFFISNLSFILVTKL